MDSLAAQRGGPDAEEFVVPLLSDVLTNVTAPAPCSATSPCPQIFNDLGRATLRAEMKDPSLTSPTTTNAVTITRYHVSYRRADGRNAEGVDVPFAFDGATTATVSVGSQTAVPLELVRHVAKMESPLVSLANSATIVTMIAEVTLYGFDQAGNGVTITGLIQIDFGNFGD